MPKKVIFDMPDEMFLKVRDVEKLRGLGRSSLCRLAISRFIEEELPNGTKPNTEMD